MSPKRRADAGAWPLWGVGKAYACRKYKGLGIEQATAGRVLAQRVRANMAPDKGTGWHRHEAQFHIAVMTKGWARFMYRDQETLVVAGGLRMRRWRPTARAGA